MTTIQQEEIRQHARTMTTKELSDKLGLTYYQVWKYCTTYKIKTKQSEKRSRPKSTNILVDVPPNCFNVDELPCWLTGVKE